MFPPLAEEWLAQFNAQKNWKRFDQTDFLALQKNYGITWIVVQQPGVPGLDCPYRNREVMVCRVAP
jgi:hypothetical protein